MNSFKTFEGTLRPFATLAVIAALGFAVSACSEAKTETVSEVVRPVKVVEIANGGESRKLDYSGSVKARTEMNLGFRVAGKITERLVDIGDRVEPGEVLARIDATDYELAVRTAEANLVAAEKQVETAGLVKQRVEQLFAKKVASQANVDEAVLSHQQAVASRDAARSSLQQAMNQVAYGELKADRDGIVTALGADRGQVVAIGTPVVTVAVDDEKEIQIAVPEGDVAHFRPGKPVTVGFWTNDRLRLDGKVREVAGSADPRSRTFSVRISLPDDPRVLLGMTATVRAAIDTEEQMVSVPLEALAEKDGKKIVWIVDRPTATVHSREVAVADFTANGVRVTEGLRPGDIVVAAGTQFMAEELKVKLPEDSAAVPLETAETTR
ncbi:efflux RND transporter periplasmic adaptor subunit [Mesorhizobium sp. 1B3]|uniref:efflux RND transporter periplasmic adaptor subunit n=1 Tax=Mesorhizobium sp. 1B3 TaxID=3243599 RepID=UPI003D9558E8